MTLLPFEMTKAKKLAEYRDHPVLFENISYDEWKRLSLEKKVPVGACWIACLGIVFGPKGAS